MTRDRKAPSVIAGSTELARTQKQEIGKPWAETHTIPGPPPAKPRMTQRDRWMRRPCVVAYRNWADLARAIVGPLPLVPGSITVEAVFALPQSWPPARKKALAGLPHRVKPDADNVAKAVLDALLPQDSGVYELLTLKRWQRIDEEPHTEVRLRFLRLFSAFWQEVLNG